MKIHGKIQEKLRKDLKKKGYDVFIEASIKRAKGSFFIVDILAIKDKEKLVIEIGRTPQNKINEIRNLGYRVSLVPFHKYLGNRIYKCICGHKWKSRVAKPKACPKCKQRLFYNDEEYKDDK